MTPTESPKSLITAWFRHRSAVLALTVYLTAAYLLTFIVPMLDWPEWINRLSVFTAFGNPYLEWPTLLDSLVIVGLAGPGLALSFMVTARSPKAP